MALLPSEDSLTNAATTNAQQKSNFVAIRAFLADLLGVDSDNKAAAREALGAVSSDDMDGFVEADGSTDFTAAQKGVAGTDASHLTTKGQVEGGLTAHRAKALSNTRTNYVAQGALGNVVGSIGWAKYGDGHTITDANSSGATYINPDAQWDVSCPSLMAYNGSATFGVRVDRARRVDRATVDHAGALVEFGQVVSGAVDLPDPYVLIGLRGNPIGYSGTSVLIGVFLRGCVLGYGSNYS